MNRSWNSGDVVEGFKRGPITADILKAYAKASRDTNPIHWDRAFAQSAGFDRLIAHGMLSMAFLGDCVRKNFPRKSYHIKRLKARFRKVVFEGDTLAVAAIIKKASGDGISMSLTVHNQNDELVTDGEATVVETCSE